MDISSTTQTAGLASRAAETDVSANNASALSSDFETFLKMLTVQMENQDPLNPLQSSDFAVQLATFSGVEQQVQTNDLLKSLAAQFGQMNVSQLAGWVGMEGRAEVSANYQGTPITLAPSIPSAADQATLIVRNATGQEVLRSAMPLNEDQIIWGGSDNAGTLVPHGLYSFELETRQNGDLLDVQPIPVYSRISEARIENGQTMLVFESGDSVAASDVLALREPLML